MKPVQLPAGFKLERLSRAHPRKSFHSGEPAVDDWLRSKACQHQDKHLSVSKALLDESGRIAGFFTLATGQIDFGDLPADVFRRLPRRMLPVAVLAWLGVDQKSQGQGLGARLLSIALRDCYDAGQTLSFVAVIVDCINPSAKSFYAHWGFRELPGLANRLFLSADDLAALIQST